jgi:hypothetical protein
MRLVLLTLLLLPIRAWAAPEWCSGPTWPTSRDTSIAELAADFENADRFELTQYAWGELTSAQAKPMFAPILQYLAATESNDELRGYFKAMGYFALGRKELPEGLKKWPDRAAHNGRGFSLEELCQMYRKSGGAVPARSPDSVKAKKAAVKGKKNAR